jgi:YaiO family outer membrane protein
MDRSTNILLCLSITFFSFDSACASTGSPTQINQAQSLSTDASRQSIDSQVKTLLQSSNLSGARILTTSYLEKHPEDVDLLLVLGLINVREKNYSEAEINLKKVLNKKPTYMEARVALIRLLINNKQFKEAFALIEQGLNQNPKQGELIELKEKLAIAEVNSLREEGKIELAKETAIHYINANPNFIDLKFILGLIYLQQKKYLSAETEFNQVLQQKPNYLDARLAFIKAKIAQNNYQYAETLLAQGLAISPMDKKLQSLKMTLAANKDHLIKKITNPLEPSQSDPEKIKEPPKTALKDSPSPDLLNQIKALYKDGKLSEAKHLAVIQLKSKPDDLDALLFIGLIDYRQNNYNASEKTFDEILKKKPTYMDARIALIRLKINNKQWKDASILIEQGLSQNSKQVELIDFKEKINKETTKKETTKIEEIKQTSPGNGAEILSQIKALREAGKLNLAKEKAINYLAQNPKDSDVALILGLIYFAEKDYSNAELQLKSVLQKTPSYVEARAGLIKIKLIQKDFTQAKALLSEGFKITPKDKLLVLLNLQLNNLKAGENKKPKPVTYEMVALQKVKQYLSEKKYSEARNFLKSLVQQYPNKHEFRIALAYYYVLRQRDMEALILIREGLRYNPSDYDLLIKEGEIHVILRQYSLAARAYKQALIFSPNEKNAKGKLAELEEYSPRYKYGVNEIGIWSDNSYVSDLHSVWDYSNIHYSRDTNYGRATARVNYASRIYKAASQLELNFSPRFNRNIYADLMASYANEAALFPTYAASFEGYINFPRLVEVSGGGKYSRIKNTYFSTWTGSLNVYPGKYWLSFRPLYFVPKAENPQSKKRSRTSILYTAKIRRYFATDDHYIGLGAGSGTSPDLADLLTADFIVIKNSFVNIDYNFPILKSQIIVNISLGYQHWRYPTGLLRELYNGSIGFKRRF